MTELARPGLALECTGAAVHYEHDNGGVLLNRPMDEMPTCREVIGKYAIIPARRPSQVAGGGGLDGARVGIDWMNSFRMRRDTAGIGRRRAALQGLSKKSSVLKGPERQFRAEIRRREYVGV